MKIAYRSYVLLASLLLLVIMTVQLWWNIRIATKRLEQGGQVDSGMFPKRTRNINAYYVPRQPQPSDPTAGHYPYTHDATMANPAQSGGAARIGFPKTTACPIFRAQDDGSTDPLLIG